VPINPVENVYVVESAADLPDELSRFVIYHLLYDPGTGTGLYYSADESTLTKVDAPAGAEVNDLTAAVTWANVPDANITESSVTQHEAALTILETQITDGAILARLAAAETVSGAWDFSAGLDVRGGTLLRIYDSTNTDYASFSHDGTDFNTTFLNTTDWNIDGVVIRIRDSGGVRIQDGADLRVQDATDTDYIALSHNGINTAINTNAGSIQFTAGSAGDYFQFLSGSQLRVYDSGNTDYVAFGHDGTDFNITLVNTTEVNVTGADLWYFDDDVLIQNVVTDMDGVQTSRAGISFVHNSFGATNKAGTGNYNIGLSFRFHDTAAGAQLVFASNGSNLTPRIYARTDSWTAGVDWQSWYGPIPFPDIAETISGAWDFSGGLDVLGGTSLRVYDSTDTDNVAFSHDGTNFSIMPNASGGYVQLGAATLNAIRTQVYNSTGITSAGKVLDHSAVEQDIGFNLLPAFNINASDTLEAAHCGHLTGKTNTTSYTLTGPSNTDFDFPIGGMCTVANFGSSVNYTIADTATCTMYYMDGSAAPVDIAGSGTLAPGGVINLYRYDANTIYIWGFGFTA